MDINFSGKYKALKEFSLKGISNLTIITGLNGVGKSQLLNLIYSSVINGVTEEKNRFPPNNSDYELKFENFSIEPRSTLYWRSSGGNINIENKKFGYQDLKFIVKFLINHINGNKEENSKLLKWSDDEDHSSGKVRLRDVLNQKKDKIIEVIEEFTGKNRIDLSPDEISYFFPEHILLEDRDLFSQDSLEFIFYMYLYKNIASRKYKLNISIDKKAPWVILNEVLESANFPYRVTSPNEDIINPIFTNALNDLEERNFSVDLINPEDNEKIGFNNISSGERIIASLALLLYYTQNRKQNKSLLILDEPDAHLHPSLTQHFFDVIQNVLIKKHKARVIMATHSPSTVALSPSDFVYVMDKSEKIIQKSTKDKALKILTTGVPYLSINYENRRQVFVESKYDVKFYESIYLKLQKFLDSDITLNFISSGDSKANHNGNCDQVITITKTLRNSGNNFIWGLIDYDGSNNSEEYIKVIGNGERYSIENFILDPILVSSLLIREKMVNKIDYGLENDENFYDLKKFDNNRLQNIIDVFLDKIGIDNKEISTVVKLVNGNEIKVPNDYLQYQGHSLENKIVEKFPKLNSIKKNKEDALKMAIIDKVIDDIPELTPYKFIETFEELQK